ncbi:MAG: hypothetical protein WCT40_02610 [Candidatus Magasanikbacteria bacterium]
MASKITKKNYSALEAKKIIDSYIDESSLRLRKKLVAEWKRQAQPAKKLLYA